MRPHPHHSPAGDPLHQWVTELQAAVVTDLSPDSVGLIVGVAGTVAATTATAALAAVAGGGTTMATTIAASAASHSALKVGAFGLCAALAAGGTAAVTGNLPHAAQEFAADAAAHIGITLPRPAASIATTVGVRAGDIVTVDGAGQVGVRIEGGRLLVTGIDAEAGFVASIVSESSDAVIVEFRSATETATLMLTKVEGEITSGVTVRGGADAGTTGTDAEAETGLEVKVGG